MPIIGSRGAGVRGLGFQGAAAPNQVSGLTATDFGTGRAYNNGRIDLSWTAPANNGATISGYKIERSTNGSSYSTLVANTGTTATTYSDTSLSSNQIYYYKVSAINSVGNGLASTAANATATTVPQAPVIGTPTATNSTTVSLPFTVATGGKSISAYAVTSSPSISLTVTGSSSPLTVVGSYASNIDYTFTMTATNANGTSAASSASSSVRPNKTYALQQTFNSSGTYNVGSGISEILVVVASAGTAGGTGSSGVFNEELYVARGGNGGAGGRRGSGAAFAGYSVNSGQNFSVTVGSTSSFGSLASAGANTQTVNVAGGQNWAGAAGGGGGNGVTVSGNGSQANGNPGSSGNASQGIGVLGFNITLGGSGGGGGGGASTIGQNGGNATGGSGGAAGSGGGGAGGGGGNSGITYNPRNGVYINYGNAGSAGTTVNTIGAGGGGGGGGGAGYFWSIAMGAGGAGGNGGPGQVLVYGR